jgi:methylated-DNA-[protein]-cysteine S-methyltransferase
LGLGELIVSPSWKYLHLVQRGDAAVATGDDGQPAEMLSVAYYHSPAGWLKIEASDTGVRTLRFCDDAPAQMTIHVNPVLQDCIRQLDEYFSGKRFTFDVPIELSGTEFQLSVWRELLAIPYGETISYIELSRRIGDVKAVRAVGGANGQNKISIIVPCHRVIGADGKLTGYAGGLRRKEWLLRHELQYNGEGLFKTHAL